MDVLKLENVLCLVKLQKTFFHFFLQRFQLDMRSRQQVLAAILDEGEQMVYREDMSEAADFERKLEQLEERWHSVVRRVNQRKTLVDERVMQWQQYHVSIQDI